MKFTTTFFVVVVTTLTTAQQEQKSRDTTKIEELTKSTHENVKNNQQFGDRQWIRKRGTITNSKGEQYRIKVIKKPTKNGKLNTIHLYPIKKDEKKISLKAAIEHDRNPGFLEGSNASPKVEKMMDVQKYEDEPVGMETSHYEEEHKEKIKIKHHHHHHHHNHIKTVIKKEPYPVEKIVPKPYPVEKIVEKIVHMPVEKIIHKPFPVPYPVEKVVEKVVHIPKPYPVKEYVEKKVPYPVEKVIEKVVEKIVPKYIHIPKPYPVIKHVHVPIEVKVPVPIEKKVKVYVPQPIEVEKKVPYPVKIYVPQPYPVEKKIPVPVEVKVKDHHHNHPHHHYSSMDDHHGYLESKFHEETSASNDQHSVTSIQRHSISVFNPNDPHREQMKQFQQEQHQLDAQFKHSQHQQDQLNEKFQNYKKFHQKQQQNKQQKEIHQLQMQQHQHQLQHQMNQQMQHQIEQQQQQPIHGLFGQKMYSDYAKPFYPTEHQHQSILTLQTHLLQDDRYKPSKKNVPEFKPIANVKAIPIEHQPLQQTQQLYPLSMSNTMDKHIEGASSNVEPVAVEPPDETDKKADTFRINVSEFEELPKPEALNMDVPYQFQPQPDYNMYQVFQIHSLPSFQSQDQSFPVTA